MTKQLKFSHESRTAMKKGVDTLASAVKVTLGPRGRNVVIERGFGSPIITNDGVTIAKEIELEDPFENMGAQLIKEVAEKTNDVAGDGTTTATILAQAIIDEGLKHVTAGVNPMYLKRGMEKASKVVVDVIRQMSVPIKNDDEINQIATISANNDPEIGKKITEAMRAVGKTGIINVEEARSVDTTVEVVEGMQFDRGYISPYFATNPDKMTAELQDAAVLIYDKKITAMKDILPILQATAQAGLPLLIIADDLEGEALATIIVNKMRGTLSVCAVKAPGFGDRRKAMLEDIAILTGGTVISEDVGLKLESATMADLGKATKVIIDKDNTIIQEGHGSLDSIQARVDALKHQADDTPSSYDHEKIQERIAKLSSGVAVIRIGAATETEMKEKKARVDDALHATRAAIEEGIVAGGGTALIRAAKAIDDLSGLSDEERAGADTLRKAMYIPAYQIAFNAGEEGAVVVERLKEMTDNRMGYNAATNQYEDMFDSGVIDPAKVVRSALQNAVSVAGMLLTTECAITQVSSNNEPNKSLPGPEMGY